VCGHVRPGLWAGKARFEGVRIVERVSTQTVKSTCGGHLLVAMASSMQRNAERARVVIVRGIALGVATQQVENTGVYNGLGVRCRCRRDGIHSKAEWLFLLS